MSACLALVRPVGMNDNTATEWLAVAASEVMGMDRKQFENGCRDARQTCTHHGQILPTILKQQEAPPYAMADRYAADWNAALVDYSNGYPAISHGDGAKRIGDVLKGIEYEG